MSNQAWICPRCETINAPFIPRCNCKPNTINSVSVVENNIKSGVIPPIINYPDNELKPQCTSQRCDKCMGYYFGEHDKNCTYYKDNK
jgi:hypothetical protein